MKAVLAIFLGFVPLYVQALEINLCSGSVVQRRYALLQFGRIVDAFVVGGQTLPDICAAPVEGISDRVPDPLKDARVCGSSDEGAVYYVCQLSESPSGDGSSAVIESCRYSLSTHSLSCENKTLVTTFD